MKTKFTALLLTLCVLGFPGLDGAFAGQDIPITESIASVPASGQWILLAQQDTPPAETAPEETKPAALPSEPVATDNPETKKPAGEESKKSPQTPPGESADVGQPKAEEVTPTPQPSAPPPSYTGSVAYLSSPKDFVIVDFKEKNNVPPIRSELGVYRDEQFVGSIRITAPVNPPLASADVMQGTLRQGDVVR